MSQLPWICRACRSRSLRKNASSLPISPRRRIATDSRYLNISDEVRQAVSENKPVVALETAIYTHGFPYPQNLSLSAHLESLVRKHGAVPATIGILDGVARVGLSVKELDRLGSSAGEPETIKISRRDFGFALGSRSAFGKAFNGGSTIAGTMVLAHLAGIKVFATGGLGGVHRGAEQTMDVSADLTELGRTPVTVISSGCKAFLDIPKTLEYLETQGVAVATFADGREGKIDFPGFWTRESGVPTPKALRDEREAAEVIHAHLSLGLQSGLHFANPIPEHHSLPLEVMEAGIYEAIEHANLAGAIGSAATPYILNKIKEITGDKSVEANWALVEANAIRGTKVAVELATLEKGDHPHKDQTSTTPIAKSTTRIPSSGNTSTPTAKETPISPVSTQTERPQKTQSTATEDKPSVFIAGSLAIDLSCDYAPRKDSASSIQPDLNTSNPAQITQSLGGVGSNVARAAHLMGANVRLCSAVGDDLSGKAALEALANAGMRTNGIKVLGTESEGRTAQYVAVNDANKDLMLAMADMSILESSSTGRGSIVDAFDSFWLPQLQSSKPSHLVLDGNWPPQHLARWLHAAKEINARITFEPVSTAKSTGPFLLPKPHNLSTYPSPSMHLATPNTYELSAMHTVAKDAGLFDRKDWWEIIDAFGIPSSGARTQLALATSSELVDQGIPQQTLQLLPFIPTICTKLGAEGVLLTQIIPAGDPRLSSGEYAPYILSRCANETEETLGVGGMYMRLFPAVEEVAAEEVISVNGVGDTFCGTLVTGLAKRGKDARVEDLVDLAQRAAVLTLKSKESVSPGLGTLRILL